MNYLSYRIALTKLNRARDRTLATLSGRIKEARKAGGDQEAEIVLQTEKHELDEWNEKISILKTRYLLYTASVKDLPTPSMTEEEGLWEQGLYTGSFFLTVHGMTELRQLIRKERKETFDLFLPVVSLLTGLIAAISGLILVLSTRS